MFKFLSFGKNEAGVLGTLLILIALGACYFFIYLPNNEKIVQERRFRYLRNIDTNIRTKISSSQAQIRSLLNNYNSVTLSDSEKAYRDRTEIKKRNRKKDSTIHKKDSLLYELKRYISEYPKDNYTLLLPEQARKYFNNNNKHILIETDSIEFYIDPGTQFTLLAKEVIRDTGSKNNSRGLSINRDTGSKNSGSAIGIRYEFKKFITPLLSSDFFDKYIVFIDHQKLYESFPSGLNYADADSLLTVKNGIITPGFRSIKIGGTNYKVFSHPIYTYASSRYSDNRWIIIGLVSDSNYQKEKNQLPVWALLLLLITALTMLVSLPWIKLYHMGNKDRLTLKDGMASMLVAMILMSLLFFAIFKYENGYKFKYGKYHKTSKGSLPYSLDDYSRNVLASKVTEAFEKEINAAYILLDSMDSIHINTDTDVCLLGKGKEEDLRYNRLLDSNGHLVKTINNVRLAGKGQFKNQLSADKVINPVLNKFPKDNGVVEITTIYGHDTIYAVKKFGGNNKSEPVLGAIKRKGEQLKPYSLTKADTTITVPLFTKYDSLFNKTARGINLSQIFWLDCVGNEKTNLTVKPNNDPKDNYSGRNYFKNAIAEKYNKTGPKPFYIDQLISRTEGIFRSVIAIKARQAMADKSAGVAVIGFNIKSLDSLVMPDGYQFAMIDSLGRVLYHSKSNRNLNENLKDEFADSSNLVSCIEARSDTSFTAEYYGKQCNVKIMPVPNLPYFTVIFENPIYNDTRDTEAFVFTLSMLTCLLLFLTIKCSIIFFASSRSSHFKKHRFDMSWIGPNKQNHHQYNLAIIVNLFIILILIFFFILFGWNSFLLQLFILLISIVFTSLFLNYIFAVKYKYYADFYKYGFKIRAIVALLLFIAVIDIAACIVLTPMHIFVLIIYELLLLFISPLIFSFGKLLLTRIRKFKPYLHWTYTQSYAFMVTTRLIITSGIPVAFFYIYSFDYEQNLDTRYRQLNFATALTQKIWLKKTDIISNNKKLDSIKNNLLYTSGIYYDGMYIESVDTSQMDEFQDPKEDGETAEIMGAFRYMGNDLEVKNNNLNLQSAGSNVSFGKISSDPDGKHTTCFKTYYKTSHNIDSRVLKISSMAQISYQPPYWHFWIFLILAVLLFYWVIYQIIRKIFALDMSPTERWRKLDSTLLKTNDFTKLVLIVGSPGSDTLLKLKYRINIGHIKSDDNKQLVLENSKSSNVFIADMSRIPANGKPNSNWNSCTYEALSGYPLVIVNHFEYNICDPASNNLKLDLLESLIRKGGKVIIISTMHPLTFLDSFNDQQKNPISESEMGRWHMLLGNFRVMIDPLIVSSMPDTQDEIKKAIMHETRYSRFLYRMRSTILKFLEQEERSRAVEEETKEKASDSLIFKLQLTSQYFYTDIWQSLTQEEKFILYDLAEDGLVNASDDFNVNMLICKGLIIRPDGPLMLFNKSFRNFILTAIGQKEMNRIKAQVKDSGNWRNLRAPMNLAILAILAFLLASQQEAYSKLIAYITALSGGIPVILKIFSMVGGSQPKKTE